MNKFVKLLLFLSLFAVGTAFAQITLDGDSSDWAGEPILVNWVNNQDGWYPSEVGAAITDQVNVRHIKD